MQFVGGSLVYVAPATQVDTGLVCNNVSFGIDYSEVANTNTNGEVVLTIDYGIPDTDNDENDEEIGSVSGELGGSMLQMAKGSYEWTEGSKSEDKLGDEDGHPFKIVPHAEISFTLKNQQTADIVSLSSLFGNINSGAFFIPGINNTIPAYQCRFDGASVSRRFTTQSYPFWDISYKFAAAGHNWNKFWDGEQYSSVDKTTYPESSFAGIF